MQNSSWFRERIRQVHLDFHMPEFVDAMLRADPKHIVGQLVKARVNVVGLFTKCHFGNSYYDTKYGYKHPYLRSDWFGEVLEECHKNDIKVIAYYSLATDVAACRHNPDWYQINAEGKPKSTAGTCWDMPCLNSPYREELVIPQLREITENYDIDGYMIDMPYQEHHLCFCKYCRKKFEETHGFPLEPAMLETDRERVIRFGIDTAVECMREIYSLVKGIKPHLMVACNGAWKMGEPGALDQCSDYGLWESQPGWGTFLGHSIRSRYARTLGVPMQIMTVRFTDGWGMLTCKPPAQLKYEVATIAANGGIVNVGDQAQPDGSLQEPAYDLIGEVFRFLEEREPYVVNAESVKHVALISRNTSDWYWNKPGDPHLFGAAKMLIEGHWQFDLFEDLRMPDLKPYSAVVVTANARLDEAQAEQLRAFVRDGGVLVLEGMAGFDQASRRFLLEDVMGVRYAGQTPYDYAYFTVNETVWGDLPRIPHLALHPFIKVRADGATALSRLQWPYTVPSENRAFRSTVTPAGIVSDFPAISVNTYGKGTCLYFAVPVSKAYGETNHYWLRRIFNNVLNSYIKDRPFTAAASPTVEVNMMRRGDRRFLHLINFQNNHSTYKTKANYDPIEYINPVHGIEIEVRDPGIREAILQPEGVALELKRTENGTAFTVPRLDIYCVVELR